VCKFQVVQTGMWNDMGAGVGGCDGVWYRELSFRNNEDSEMSLLILWLFWSSEWYAGHTMM